ncbi:MAG TPA: Ger(x)C family spore germination protein, partial [Firmicutes bacterium]|nr:Ger(x)C family spore germination protein [Bacillota bacterium]
MSLTMQVINPVMTSGSEDAILIVTAVADSLFMATRKARHMLSRQPYWGQLQIFVISEEIARRSIKPVLDPLSRDYETNRQAWVLIAKGVTAKTILHAGWGFTGIPATEILGLVQMAYADGLINIANVNDMVMSLERGGQSTTTGYLELSFDTKHPPQQIDPEAKVVLAGSAVFCKDRLVGYFDQRLSRGINWVTGDVKNTAVELIESEDAKGMVTIEVVAANSKVKAKLQDDKPVVHVDMEVVGHLVDVQDTSLDLNAKEVIDNLNRRLATTIRLEVEDAVRQAQTLASDVFGFGAEFYRTFPKLWATMQDDWNNIIFPTMEVNVTVEATIKLTGIIRQPLGHCELETD